MNINGNQTGLPAPRLRLAEATPAHAHNARRSLVATTVPAATIDETPTQQPSHALPFYRHPADRNAAATAIHAGRTLDLQA